ncbi:hypothetical protein A6302_00218 [Methylobrevis pamukkalensis]|uniref:Uncharacterized protein n=1 Tax=Methylobrevis pamukkalensis TaxID=1439726 RepID=A0A1E3H819_9HYPH|nr:hypothetical protein A6302_00218 [Methylobrevis pamukkalensis]
MTRTLTLDIVDQAIDLRIDAAEQHEKDIVWIISHVHLLMPRPPVSPYSAATGNRRALESIRASITSRKFLISP